MIVFRWTIDQWLLAATAASVIVSGLLIYVTLLSMNRSVMEIASMLLGRSGNVGRHSRWQQKERAKDTHKHVTGEGRCGTVTDCIIALREDKD